MDNNIANILQDQNLNEIYNSLKVNKSEQLLNRISPNDLPEPELEHFDVQELSSFSVQTSEPVVSNKFNI